ncbi:MAG: hypothetical protein RMJ66_03770 [Bacteroidia bacterium]|nr:hypothetical protein [Bacteroidia bacterium]MDW8134165.1 hypothetical protein [Bacteroidia bacterium]
MKEGLLYLLLKEPIENAILSPLPLDIQRNTIERSLWEASEKALLRQHYAYMEWRFSLYPDPVEAFIKTYEYLKDMPQLVGIANPLGCTAHTSQWIDKIFRDGLVEVARKTPPIHLWTGLIPVSVEPSLETLLSGYTPSWIRTIGYEQFGLPDLAHPLKDTREIGWIHSLFEVLFDWMYENRRRLRANEAIEVPERGRYVLREFEGEVLALIEWQEKNGETVAFS